jgi:hypothetical protein
MYIPRSQPSVRALLVAGWLFGLAAFAQPQVLPGKSKQAPPQSNTTIILSFDGLSSDGTALPPDTNGAVGNSTSNQFVQSVNLSYAIYNKTTGAPIQGPLPGNTPWLNSSSTPHCAANNDGQPIAQFDKAAGRWVITQQVLKGPPYYFCVAVSASADATGAYYPYEFSFKNMLPNKGDYPYYGKLAVWPDPTYNGYYASFDIYKSGNLNGPIGSPIGTLAVAYDRMNMLNNASARTPVFSFLPSPNLGLLPSDYDGTSEPAGEPNYYLELDPTGNADLNLFKFAANFSGSSNFTGPTSISGFTYRGCSAKNPSWAIAVNQPSPGSSLDTFGDRLMYRNAWRRIGGTEYLVANHTVMPPGGSAKAGIAWYDIINPNSNPSVLYSNTFYDSSPTGTSYWIGSIAMDQLGNLALGFNASGSGVDPSAYYTDCVVASGECNMEAPQLVVPGGGVQENSSAWGQYSSISVDPADDCTLWFTTEYIASTGSFPNWNTHIVAFKFNSCP